MLMELAKIKELQNSILGRVSEIEQIKRNTAKVAKVWKHSRILTILMPKRSSWK